MLLIYREGEEQKKCVKCRLGWEVAASLFQVKRDFVESLNVKFVVSFVLFSKEVFGGKIQQQLFRLRIEIGFFILIKFLAKL